MEELMAHEETVMELMNQLVIADKHVIGDIMAHKGIWTEGTSASNNADKVLKVLCDYNLLEKVECFYRLIECKSTYAEHSKLLTKFLADILKLNITTKIFREKTLNEIGLRPDGLVLLIKDNQKLCFILEVCNNEFPEFLQQKVNAWRQWENSLRVLSELFGTKIHVFDIVVAGDISAEGTFEFNQYLKEIKEVNQ
jgi:hypothetical protein